MVSELRTFRVLVDRSVLIRIALIVFVGIVSSSITLLLPHAIRQISGLHSTPLMVSLVGLFVMAGFGVMWVARALAEATSHKFLSGIVSEIHGQLVGRGAVRETIEQRGSVVNLLGQDLVVGSQLLGTIMYPVVPSTMIALGAFVVLAATETLLAGIGVCVAVLIGLSAKTMSPVLLRRVRAEQAAYSSLISELDLSAVSSGEFLMPRQQAWRCAVVDLGLEEYRSWRSRVRTAAILPPLIAAIIVTVTCLLLATFTQVFERPLSSYGPAVFYLILIVRCVMQIQVIGPLWHAGRESLSRLARLVEGSVGTHDVKLAASPTARLVRDGPSALGDVSAERSVSSVALELGAVGGAGLEALTGPSGAGKSVFLEEVLSIASPGPRRRGGKGGQAWPSMVSTSLQASAVASFSVGDMTAGMSPREIDRFRSLVSIFCLPREFVEAICEENVDRRPFANSSSGEAKRLSVARALSLSAELTVLDEPTAGLDPVAGALVQDEILRQSESRRVLAATHDDLLSSRAMRVWAITAG